MKTNKSEISLLIALLMTLCLSAPFGGARADGFGDFLGTDSLSLAGEVFVLTDEELRDYNINTFDDILEIAPGAQFWRSGPPASKTGFSIDGSAGRGTMLLINGRSVSNVYTGDPIVKYVDLSRIKKVEFIYSGSPSLTGYMTSGGVVNIVLETGGREPPASQADFTYGDDNCRARRIWFSTPRSYVNATLVYNEYLQDAIEALEYNPARSIGYNDTRMITAEVAVGRDQRKRGLIHLTRYDDRFERTPCLASEEITSRGFDSWIRYDQEDLVLFARHFGFQRERETGNISALRTEVSLRLDKPLGVFKIRAFAGGTRDLLENRFEGFDFNSEIHKAEGGLALFTPGARGFFGRMGVNGGSHSETGQYIGGEVGISRRGGRGAYETLMLMRKLRIPSVAELSHPFIGTIEECYDVLYAGNWDLSPEVVHEAYVEKSFSFGLVVNTFYRRKSDMIIGGEGGQFINSEDEDDTYGVRTGYGWEGSKGSFTFGLSCSGEYYASDGDLPNGIPRYRFLGRAFVKVPVFNESEILTIRFDSIETGKRSWGEIELDQAAVQNFSASISLMSAVIRFQIKNLLNTEYETVPGLRMAERHFRIGLVWNLVD